MRKLEGSNCHVVRKYQCYSKHLRCSKSDAVYIAAAEAEASKSINSRATKIPPAKKAQLLTRFLVGDDKTN